MNNIKIFDSLTHPTLNGNWISPEYSKKGRLKDLLDQFESNNVYKSFGVGMEGIGGYNEDTYSEYIVSQTDKVLPIAFLNVNDFTNIPSIISRLSDIKKKKYFGIKLHPRLGNFNLNHPFIPEIIKAANDQQLIVMLCTYFYDIHENSTENSVEHLLQLMVKIPSEKLLLLHAGTVRILETMEIARAFKNVLLDLSFTLCKYEGSSLDLDIQYMFDNFDQRICVGSDFPEISITKMRERFNKFTENIDFTKATNIAYKNLEEFIK